MLSAVMILSLAVAQRLPNGSPTRHPSLSIPRNEIPLVAVWCPDHGFAAPYSVDLRFAIWDNGTVLYATKYNQWGSSLKLGHISSKQINALRSALEKTGAFQLTRRRFWMIDGPVCCAEVRIGGKQVVLTSYAVDFNWPFNKSPQSAAFGRCWNSINHLGISVLPHHAKLVKKTEFTIPDTWGEP